MSYNWTYFIRRIPVKAPPKAIYDAWTTQQGLESWFLRMARFTKEDGTTRPRNSQIEKGDRYTWLWHGFDDNAKEENEILAANGWDSLQFSFSGKCIVTVKIELEEGETVCSLKQEMPMQDKDQQQHFFIECGNGWSFYLVNLKSVLEGGLDLRNKNLSIKMVINA